MMSEWSGSKEMNASKVFWKESFVTLDSDIQLLIHNLNYTGFRIALVVDEHNYLIGTVSDGDIRRGLISGLTLSSPIIGIINKTPITVSNFVASNQVLDMMNRNKLQQIPIVDNSNCVVGLHNWYEIKSDFNRDVQVVIMAGGKGTRLHPKTLDTPKSMLLVNGKPILRHIIEKAKTDGFSEFIIAVNYLSQAIEDYFGNGDSLGVRINYLREETELGTAGALSLITPVPLQPVIVTNGDLITSIDFGKFLDFHLSLNSSATMAVAEHQTQNPYGVVEIRELEIVDYCEKPTTRVFVNAGIYVFNGDLLGSLSPGTPMDMPEFLKQVKLQNKKIMAYPLHESWMDIGNQSDLVKANDMNQAED